RTGYAGGKLVVSAAVANTRSCGPNPASGVVTAWVDCERRDSTGGDIRSPAECQDIRIIRCARPNQRPGADIAIRIRTAARLDLVEGRSRIQGCRKRYVRGRIGAIRVSFFSRGRRPGISFRTRHG